MGESRARRIEALLSEGLNHYGMGEVAEATKCWKRVLDLDPEHAEALDFLRTARDNQSQQAEGPEAGAEAPGGEGGVTDPGAQPFDPDSTLLLASDPDATVMVSPEAGPSDAEAAPRDDVDGLLERAQEVLGRGDLEGALDLFRAAAQRDPRRIEIEGYIDGV